MNIAVIFLAFLDHGNDLPLLIAQILKRVLVGFDGVVLSGARHTLGVVSLSGIYLSALTVLCGRDLGNDLNLGLYMRIQFLSAVRTHDVLNQFVQVLSLARFKFIGIDLANSVFSLNDLVLCGGDCHGFHGLL